MTPSFINNHIQCTLYKINTKVLLEKGKGMVSQSDAPVIFELNKEKKEVNTT